MHRADLRLELKAKQSCAKSTDSTIQQSHLKGQNLGGELTSG